MPPPPEGPTRLANPFGARPQPIRLGCKNSAACGSGPNYASSCISTMVVAVKGVLSFGRIPTRGMTVINWRPAYQPLVTSAHDAGAGPRPQPRACLPREKSQLSAGCRQVLTAEATVSRAALNNSAESRHGPRHHFARHRSPGDYERICTKSAASIPSPLPGRTNANAGPAMRAVDAAFDAAQTLAFVNHFTLACSFKWHKCGGPQRRPRRIWRRFAHAAIKGR